MAKKIRCVKGIPKWKIEGDEIVEEIVKEFKYELRSDDYIELMKNIVEKTKRINTGNYISIKNYILKKIISKTLGIYVRGAK